jgi:hypothetical protein
MFKLFQFLFPERLTFLIVFDIKLNIPAGTAAGGTVDHIAPDFL